MKYSSKTSLPKPGEMLYGINYYNEPIRGEFIQTYEPGFNFPYLKNVDMVFQVKDDTRFGNIVRFAFTTKEESDDYMFSIGLLEEGVAV